MTTDAFFTPQVTGLAVRHGCVVMTTAHLGRQTEIVLHPNAAFDLAKALLEQAAVASPPPAIEGAEVTEFIPTGFGGLT